MGLHKPTFDAVVGIVLHQREVCGFEINTIIIVQKNYHINTIIIVPKKLPHDRSQPSGK